VRGVGGYVGTDQVPRLNVLDLQKMIRSIPKAVIAMVAGWAIGGGHVLHVVCDLTIAADNARFGQTGPKVGSFDGGFGASYLARIVGQKKAREIWYLCDQYDAQEALAMGLVNKVVPAGQLEATTIAWCRQDHGPKARWRSACSSLRSMPNSTARRASRNWPATPPCSTTCRKRRMEGRNAWIEKRKPDWDRFPKFP
jgi:naphthoate synthase